MRKAQSRAISFRIADDKLQRLEELAAATDRSRSWHIEQAIDTYLDVQTWQLEHIEKGIAAIRQGRTIAHDEVREWLLSWGQEDEREPPK